LTILDIDIEKSEDFVLMTNLKTWYTKTMKNNNDELMNLNKKMKDAIENYPLHKPTE